MCGSPDWKWANIMPIYKSGPKDTAGNYRPISLTSIVCKVMESPLQDEIVNYLEQNNLIQLSQHRFSWRNSILTNLLKY